MTATKRPAVPVQAALVGRLGPVLRYDRDRGTAMVPTLRAYLDHAGATKAAARALSVHPHTVQYRLGRLEALSGLRLSAPQERLTLELCLRILDSAALSDTLGRD